MKNEVSVARMAEALGLKNLTPEIDLEEYMIKTPEINRPALQLAGYYEHFPNERVQIIGYVEYSYLLQLDPQVRRQSYEKFITSDIPCLIFSKLPELTDEMLELPRKFRVPILQSDKVTSILMAETIRWLGEELAPTVSLHGVLVDVYGEGVMIMGDSGIGKSEAALELVRRGHRLVTDDVVVIKKVSDVTLIGSAPDITRHFLELRGIGIIDVKTIFGVEHVKDSQQIDLIIKMEEWNKDKEYDRLGLQENYMEILGNEVVCHSIPIRPGRNIAVIVETAAVNHRQKKMGYNAAQELYRRVEENMSGKRKNK